MFNFLNKSEKRRLDLVGILAYKNEWVSLGNLAKQLNCSDRVLKDDISYLKSHFSDFTIQTSTQGVKLYFEYDKGLKSFYQEVLSQSMPYQLLEIIFFNETLSLTELSERLFTSSSTLYRMIDKINQHMSNIEFDFQIQTNPCRIIGDEKGIRYYYYQYFFEKYSRIEWPFETIPEKPFNELLMFFIDFTQMKTESAHFNIYKLTSAVNFVRFKNRHFIDMTDSRINFDEIMPNPEALADDIQFLENTLNIQFNNQFIHQLFSPYVQEGFSLNVERLFEKAKNDPKKKNELTFLSQTLDELSKTHNIALPNKEHVIWSLDNTAHLEYQEPQSGYILYNRNKLFAEAMTEEFPKFYNQLYKAMKSYRELIGKPIIEDGINFYVNTIFIQWEDLVKELRRKAGKVNVLVLSDRHTSHAQMLKDFITYEFNEQLDVSIYSEIELHKSILNKQNHDFIVTNSPLISNLNKPVVYIETVPTNQDIHKIQTTLEQVLADRNIH